MDGWKIPFHRLGLVRFGEGTYRIELVCKQPGSQMGPIVLIGGWALFWRVQPPKPRTNRGTNIFRTEEATPCFDHLFFWLCPKSAIRDQVARGLKTWSLFLKKTTIQRGSISRFCPRQQWQVDEWWSHPLQGWWMVLFINLEATFLNNTKGMEGHQCICQNLSSYPSTIS